MGKMKLPESLDESYRFARIGNIHQVGPYTHEDLLKKLVGPESGINFDQPALEIRKILLSQTPDVDMGFVARSQKGVDIYGKSSTYSLPMPLTREEVRESTKEKFKKAYPDDNFRILNI